MHIYLAKSFNLILMKSCFSGYDSHFYCIWQETYLAVCNKIFDRKRRTLLLRGNNFPRQKLNYEFKVSSDPVLSLSLSLSLSLYLIIFIFINDNKWNAYFVLRTISSYYCLNSRMLSQAHFILLSSLIWYTGSCTPNET